MPGVFAGGDCASGPASVIKAIAAAKVVQPTLMNILDIIMKFPAMLRFRKQVWMTVNLHVEESILQSEKHVRESVILKAVENCMTEKEAKQEASRCLRCDHLDTEYLKEAERHYGKSYNR